MKAAFNARHDTVSSSFDGYPSYMTSAIPTNTDQYVIVNEEEIKSIDLDEVGKYSIFDIANWFLTKKEMTQKKLQKLCYYAQAWCYALKGYRLENTDYQAWVHGPVSPSLWEKFKIFGYDSIKIKGTPSFCFAPEDISLLEDIWDTYGECTGNELEALSHRELPWIEARQGYEPEERCTVVISPYTMAKYYKSIYCGE